jgi:hypothetical protein
MSSSSDPITVGSQVELELVDRSGGRERIKVTIVQDSEADFTKGFLSEKTPLAKSLLGERAGSVIPYLMDDIFSVEILAVSKPDNQPAMKAQDVRQAKMAKTIREIEDKNAMVFASSFSGKWGDYDPDSIPKGESDSEEDAEPEDSG